MRNKIIIREQEFESIPARLKESTVLGRKIPKTSVYIYAYFLLLVIIICFEIPFLF